jgi:hypothetical protein
MNKVAITLDPSFGDNGSLGDKEFYEIWGNKVIIVKTVNWNTNEPLRIGVGKIEFTGNALKDSIRLRNGSNRTYFGWYKMADPSDIVKYRLGNE